MQRTHNLNGILNTMKIFKLIAAIIFEIILVQNANSQDKLFFKSGVELPVVIQKETADEVYYLKTGEENTRFKVLKSDLTQITYANGDSIVFTATIKKTVDLAAVETSKWKTGVENATYNCWIYGNSEFSHKVRRGIINNVYDSAIVFRVSPTGNIFPTNKWKLNYRDVSSIDQIKLRRKGSVGKGMLIGAGAGFFLGGILGYEGIPDYGIFESLPPEQNALTGGILFSIPGTIIGGIVGSFRIKIPIDKNQFQYEKHKKVIASYSNIKT